MSTIARYLSSALARLALFTREDSPTIPVTPRTPQSPLSNLGAPSLARGLVLSTSPYLKSAVADPKVSLTPVTVADAPNISAGPSFDISISSDTSTSSCSDDTLITPLRSLDTNDLFSPRCHIASLPMTPSPPHLVGLGISGVPRRDGKPGDFDGLGLVGVRRSFNTRNPFMVSGEDDDDDDGYISPTPVRTHRRGSEKCDAKDGDRELSETFLRELVFTWESDPLHTRALCTIPECDDENEQDFQQTELEEIIEPASDPSPLSSSPSSGFCSISSTSSPLPPPSPLTLRTTTRTRSPRAVNSAKQVKPKVTIPRSSSRDSHPSRTLSNSTSSSTVTPICERTTTRARNPSEGNGQDDRAVAGLSKKKPLVKGAWRL